MSEMERDYDYTQLIKNMQKEDSGDLINLLEFCKDDDEEKELEAEMNAYQNLLHRLNEQQHMASLRYMKVSAEKKSQQHMNNPFNYCIVM